MNRVAGSKIIVEETPQFIVVDKMEFERTPQFIVVD